MNNSVGAQQFGQLRARIEATFSEPAIVVVTSAARGDGKTATAMGLAESLARADRRVLFIDANVDAPGLPRLSQLSGPAARQDFSNLSRYAKPVAGQRFMGVSLADEGIASAMSMDKLRAVAFDVRSHFDFTIVDASPALHSELATLFSAVADGTLLTLRLGRFPTNADSETIKTLSRIGANMLGVFTVSPAVIRSFANRKQEVVANRLLVPAAHVTTRHQLERDSPREVVVESKSSNVVS